MLTYGLNIERPTIKYLEVAEIMMAVVLPFNWLLVQPILILIRFSDKSIGNLI